MFTDPKALAQFAEQMMTEFMQENGALIMAVGLPIARDAMRDEVKSFATISPTLKNPDSDAWKKGISDLKAKILERLESTRDAAQRPHDSELN